MIGVAGKQSPQIIPRVRTNQPLLSANKVSQENARTQNVLLEMRRRPYRARHQQKTWGHTRSQADTKDRTTFLKFANVPLFLVP